MTSAGRSWGYWTRAKLAMLAEYLDRFAIASSGQAERVYLDAFAGEGHGQDRMSGEQFSGSALLAPEAGERGGFTRFRYFELGRRAGELEIQLRQSYPGRDIKVYEGDCNETIPAALAELHALRWAPTFAFLDPDGMELAWATLQALADHKRGYRRADSPKPEYKVELWMLFPSAGIMRTLALEAAKLRESDMTRATRLFGTEDWRPIYELRRSNALSGADAREEYVNLMRWRLERVLGYRYTHPFELRNMRGGPMYHMIFATDNEAGTRIMTSIYRNAASTVPEMQREARDRRRGQQSFEFDVEVAGAQASYEYEPPWQPPSAEDVFD